MTRTLRRLGLPITSISIPPSMASPVEVGLPSILETELPSVGGRLPLCPPSTLCKPLGGPMEAYIYFAFGSLLALLIMRERK